MGDRRVVLFISHSGDLYGAEQCLLDLVSNLSGRFHPIVVVPWRGPLEKRLMDLDLEVHVVAFRGWWFRRLRVRAAYRLAYNFVAALKIRSAISARRIDVVYSNTSYSPVGLMVAAMLSVPHVCHIHEFLTLSSSARFDLGLRRSLALLSRRSAIIIATSATLADALKPYVDGAKLRIVGNGYRRRSVPTGRNRPVDQAVARGPFRLLMVGSISENKGQLIAVKALKLLVAKGLDATLTIVGDTAEPEYLCELQRIVSEARLGDRVVFAGFESDVERRYAESDLLIGASMYETFGRVIIEAMGCGCPVVCSRIPAALEIMDEGHDGLMYEYGDYTELSRRVEELAFDPEMRNRLIRHGLETFERKFTVGRYVDAIEVILWDDVLGAVRAPALGIAVRSNAR